MRRVFNPSPKKAYALQQKAAKPIETGATVPPLTTKRMKDWPEVQPMHCNGYLSSIFLDEMRESKSYFKAWNLAVDMTLLQSQGLVSILTGDPSCTVKIHFSPETAKKGENDITR